MLKNFGTVCAALLIATATFSSFAQARSGGRGGGGARIGATHFGGARINGARFAGGRVATAGGHYYGGGGARLARHAGIYGGRWVGPRGYYGHSHRGYWPYWGWGIAATAGALAVAPYYGYGYDDYYYDDPNYDYDYGGGSYYDRGGPYVRPYRNWTEF